LVAKKFFGEKNRKIAHRKTLNFSENLHDLTNFNYRSATIFLYFLEGFYGEFFAVFYGFFLSFFWIIFRFSMEDFFVLRELFFCLVAKKAQPYELRFYLVWLCRKCIGLFHQNHEIFAG